jgi:hypothetical protein
VERGVEAGHRRYVGERATDRVQRRQRLRLVKRSEGDQVAQRLGDFFVDRHRLAEALAAVDDPVPDGVRAPELGERRIEARGVGRQVAAAEQLVSGTEQPQLEAARSGVDDQNPQNGQTQSRTCSGSSPCARV